MSEDARIGEITGYREEVLYDDESLMKMARKECKEKGLPEEYAEYWVLGWKEGWNIGRKEGRAEERKRLILKMRRFGMSEEDINTIMSMD